MVYCSVPEKGWSYGLIPNYFALSITGLQQTFTEFAAIKVTQGVKFITVQELCESRGGRPGLSVLTSLLVSVVYTEVNHASALVSACP